MKRILLIMVYIALASCVFAKESKDLFEAYKAYSIQIKNTKTNFIMSMLSKDKVQKIKTLGANEFPVLSEFSRVLNKIESHFQSIKNNIGCLTINGYGENNKPIILSIKYLNENKNWGIDFVEVYYADSNKEFQNKAICPGES